MERNSSKKEVSSASCAGDGKRIGIDSTLRVRVCVRERGRGEREKRGREGERGRERERDYRYMYTYLYMHTHKHTHTPGDGRRVRCDRFLRFLQLRCCRWHVRGVGLDKGDVTNGQSGRSHVP